MKRCGAADTGNPAARPLHPPSLFSEEAPDVSVATLLDFLPDQVTRIHELHAWVGVRQSATRRSCSNLRSCV
jgi:hypothetical protein